MYVILNGKDHISRYETVSSQYRYSGVSPMYCQISIYRLRKVSKEIYSHVKYRFVKLYVY